jgi:predicted lipid-binding transport protein (Tim44 family)
MGNDGIVLLVLAGVAVFLIMRLRNVLGTRDGFEPTETPSQTVEKRAKDRGFEVIEGGVDRDIADHVEIDSQSGMAFAEMKKIEPSFSVSDFQSGSRQAYEMILMAFEGDDLDTLQAFLSDDVYEIFSGVISDRASKNLKVDAKFVGVRELKVVEATFDPRNKEAEITMRFIGELTSVVRHTDGTIVEGDETAIKRQKDVWTFARIMGSADPNWELVATSG